MKGKKIMSLLTALTLLPSIGAIGAHRAEAADIRLVTLDPSEAPPWEFEGFGTSIGWWGNRVGYSDELAQQAAELFFSEDGLGLDIVRYNVGGGDDPAHNHVTRSDSKLPCFAVPTYNEDGTLKRDENGDVEYTYNWDNDKNQMNVLRRIKEQNPNVHIEGYTNSPPWFMAKTGCSGGGTVHMASNGTDVDYIEENLDPSNYDNFATFLGDVTEHMSEIGLPFDSYSPMNEPCPDTAYWGENSQKQEGNLVAQGEHQSGIIVALKNEYKKRGINTLVAGADETDATLAANGYNKLTDEAKAALDRIDTHTYGFWKSTNDRAAVKKAALAAGKPLWMSEDDWSWAFWGLADQIRDDLNIMQAGAWCMWDIIDRHKDAKFVAPDGSTPEKDAAFDPTEGLWGVGMADHDNETILLANKYYAFGQYSRYVHPGDTLIASSNETFAAYNKKSGDIKIVLSNDSDTDRKYSFDLSAFTNVGAAVTEIRSNNLKGSDAEHWKEISGEAKISGKTLDVTSKAGTITTFVVNGGKATNYAVIKGGGEELSLGSKTALTLKTDIEGDVAWSVSDTQKAEISKDGVITAVKSGDITVYAEVGGFKVSRNYTIPQYSLSGTPSWGNNSNRPSDDADYLKAADGDFATFFDGNQNGWVQYDFATPFKITEIKLAARSGYTDRSKGGEIQASNDGINWTVIYKNTAAIEADKYTTVSAAQLSDNHAYRYYRYTNPDDMTNIAEFLIDGEISADTPSGAPRVTDIKEFTDSFENDGNIFNADKGALDSDGNKVFASNLARFKNAFAPVKATAEARLETPIELTAKDKFRLRFDMFAGWEDKGKDNTFALKDKEGNEIFALYITGGGYTLSEARIGGKNALDGTRIAQCRSNPGTSKAGANGWNASGQPYVNTVGYNKSVEITIDGAGNVAAELTGGMEDIAVSGTVSVPASIGSMELTGNYNSSRERVVSYDNFDADVISYTTDFEEEPSEQPSEKPSEQPDGAELINLSFDNGDLTSSAEYGRASGSPEFVEADGRKCIKFDGTRATAVTLTNSSGGGLLAGEKNLTISFKVKPTAAATSWWFFAAPDASGQSYQKEKYLGAMTKDGVLTVERYNNSGERSAAVTGAYKANEWNDVIISVKDNETTLYINGEETATVESTVNVSDMLGANPVAYIGLANWNEGEYATGYIDDFVIKKGALKDPLSGISLGDTSAVTENIVIPKIDGVTWTTSDDSVVKTNGTVTRADETKTAVLTASVTENGISFVKSFEITVIGKAAFADDFAAYYEDGKIKYTSSYSGDVTPYNMYVALKSADGLPIGIKLNTANGEFDAEPDATYTISCYAWDKNSVPKHKPVQRTIKTTAAPETGAYLFAHFVGTEGDADSEQIYFSVSEDGTTWKTLNGGKQILTSTVGEKGVRDPYILRGEDGKFFVIATDLSIYNRRGDPNRWGTCQTSGSKNIVVWESDDLISWSEARLVKVAPDNAGCTWAPECIYDAERGAYMVFWASKTSDDNYSTQRMYRSYTKDFVTFTEPEIYIDGGNISNIDTTIVSDKGVYYRFTKNESKSSVTMMRATSLDGPWKDVSTYTINGAAGNTVTGYEGPAIYKLNGTDSWCLLLDYYSKSGGYKPFITTDITVGEFKSANDFTFDTQYRHGTVMPITVEEYSRLVEKYPF